MCDSERQLTRSSALPVHGYCPDAAESSAVCEAASMAQAKLPALQFEEALHYPCGPLYSSAGIAGSLPHTETTEGKAGRTTA